MEIEDNAGVGNRSICRIVVRLHRAVACSSGILCILLLLFTGCGPSPRKAADAIRRGDASSDEQKFDAAVLAYRDAVRADPQNGEAHLKLAQALQSAGNWTAAVPEAAQAAKLLPSNVSAQELDVRLMLAQQEWITAAARVGMLLRWMPNHPTFDVLQGDADAHLSNSWIVVMAFDDAARQHKDFDAVRRTLRAGATADNDEHARQAFEHALQLDPDAIEAKWGLANLFWAQGQLDAGADVLRQIADAQPADPLPSRALGLYDVRTGRIPDAAHYLEASAATHDRTSELTLADFYTAQHDDDRARSILESIAAAPGADTSMLLRLADLELRLKRIDQAARWSEAVLARAPYDPHALRIKAQILVAQGRVPPAAMIAAGRAAVAADPDSADAHVALAQALEADGQTESAFEEFSQAYRLDPDSAAAPKALVRVALALGRNNVAVEFARMRVRQHPDDDDAEMDLVAALIHARNFTDAAAALQPLLAHHSDSAALLVERAAIEGGRGDHDKAGAFYARALAADPQSFDALSGIVTEDLAAGHTAAAVQQAEAGAATHAADARYLLLAAQADAGAHAYARAESLLRRILASNRDAVDAGVLLADVLTKENRSSDALDLLNRLTADRPASTPAAMALGALLEARGDTDQAIARYEQIVTAHPDAARAASRLAVLYADRGVNGVLALTLATGAKQQQPADPIVDDALGWVYVQRGMAMTGIPYLEDAVRLSPSDPDFRYHLGAAYGRANQLAKAREQLTRALAAESAFPDASRAKAALAQLK